MIRFNAAGNLAADPVIRNWTGKDGAQHQLLSGRLLSNAGRKDANGKEIIESLSFIVSGDKRVAALQKYLKKGTFIAINGEQRTNHYTDQAGVEHYRQECLVDQLEFVNRNGAPNAEAAPAEEDGTGLPF